MSEPSPSRHWCQEIREPWGHRIFDHADTLKPIILITIDHNNLSVWIELLKLWDKAVSGHIGDGDKSSCRLPQQFQRQFFFPFKFGLEHACPQALVSFERFWSRISLLSFQVRREVGSIQSSRPSSWVPPCITGPSSSFSSAKDMESVPVREYPALITCRRRLRSTGTDATLPMVRNGFGSFLL